MNACERDIFTGLGIDKLARIFQYCFKQQMFFEDTLYLYGVPVTDSDVNEHIIPFLERNPHIKTVDIRFSKVTDKGAGPLSKIETVEKLYI